MTAPTLTPAQRAARMRRLRSNGWTYQRIADRFGVSKQRVHAIINRTRVYRGMDS